MKFNNLWQDVEMFLFLAPLAEIPSCLSQQRENGASVKVNLISILFTTIKTWC